MADVVDESDSGNEWTESDCSECDCEYMSINIVNGKIIPYSFEPVRNSSDPEESDEDEEGDEAGNQNRLVDIQSWCHCTNCILMAVVKECLCCKEVDKLKEKTENLSCITEHEGFEPVCLNRYTLQTAYFEYRQKYEDHPSQDIHERYRDMACRQFVRWNWEYLGKHIRIPLPSCVVIKIRNTFPPEECAGFTYPPLPNSSHSDSDE